jgi:acyl carrier protein
MSDAPSLPELEAVVRPHLKFLGAAEPLSPTQPLGESGLDSMASIDLLLDLERAFGITISDDDLTENSFATLEEIGKLVAASRG